MHGNGPYLMTGFDFLPLFFCFPGSGTCRDTKRFALGEGYAVTYGQVAEMGGLTVVRRQLRWDVPRLPKSISNRHMIVFILLMSTPCIEQMVLD
jgi:hypothetical protein